MKQEQYPEEKYLDTYQIVENVQLMARGHCKANVKGLLLSDYTGK